MSRYKVLPRDCPEYNIYSFNNIPDLLFTIIDEIEGIDAGDAWLCGACAVTNCTDRKQNCIANNAQTFKANKEY